MWNGEVVLKCVVERPISLLYILRCCAFCRPTVVKRMGASQPVWERLDLCKVGTIASLASEGLKRLPQLCPFLSYGFTCSFQFSPTSSLPRAPLSLPPTPRPFLLHARLPTSRTSPRHQPHLLRPRLNRPLPRPTLHHFHFKRKFRRESTSKRGRTSSIQSSSRRGGKSC